MRDAMGMRIWRVPHPPLKGYFVDKILECPPRLKMSAIARLSIKCCGPKKKMETILDTVRWTLCIFNAAVTCRNYTF